ncbi:MAG: multiple sugar transport system permease protein [Thermoanaerobacterium sp.]|uniref:carbohydrate ABC transporter permease n=1 Tax=Thermoanaerobacterium thermosaccharolyticum TaxID=1517 RepID=UPI0024AB9AAF|nr:multiple sugar transport system permease protein [Thermoanaerobacterium sp.]MDK2829612.1 multiple sugar transport system permease protein [Clostridium butyricum]MDN5316617.1 multiple sugar transport system permease protein [Thermoanaerobacterium sp.]
MNSQIFGNKKSIIETKSHISYGRTVKMIFVYLLLIIISIFFLIPLVWMISTSLKPLNELYSVTPHFIPQNIMWSNYKDAVNSIPFFVYLKNTLIYAVVATFGVTVSSFIVAYGFSKIDWKGREFLFFVLLMTMMLPPQVTMIPVYIIFKHLGWVNSLRPLIIPSFFGSAFYIFLTRQFMLTIPNEFCDSARIDGANEWQILWKIIAPMCRPIVWTIIVFNIVGTWNDFMGPLIYLSDESKYTLSLGLQQFMGAHSTLWNELMAASALTTIPMIILFFFSQKTMLEGITLSGGIKQ